MFEDGLKIRSIFARNIYDSRSNPTVACKVTLECGAIGKSAVPSGASKGSYEAHELRDGGKAWNGKGVLKAVANINSTILRALRGARADRQRDVDALLVGIDSSPDRSSLGANAILAVSLAVADAAACAYRLPLYRYIGGITGNSLPVPMMNVLNGGAHAGNNLDIQEFMIVPSGFPNFAKAMKAGSEIYGSLKKLLVKNDLSVSVGDEGGFAPDLGSDEDAVRLLTEAISLAGYEPGKDVFIALDCAASEWYSDGGYLLPKRGVGVSSDGLCDFYSGLCDRYPICSIEDPFAEDDWESFRKITAALPKTQIVGDDLFVTNTARILKGISEHAANAVLIKPNQIGTLTETLDAIALAKANGYRTVVSHRSGETTDTAIADICVGSGAGQIKTGAPARGERVCKYNRLLEIEEDIAGGEGAVTDTDAGNT